MRLLRSLRPLRYRVLCVNSVYCVDRYSVLCVLLSLHHFRVLRSALASRVRYFIKFEIIREV